MRIYFDEYKNEVMIENDIKNYLNKTLPTFSDTDPEFADWLNDNYSPYDIYVMSEEKKEREFQIFCEQMRDQEVENLLFGPKLYEIEFAEDVSKSIYKAIYLFNFYTKHELEECFGYMSKKNRNIAMKNFFKIFPEAKLHFISMEAIDC